MDTLASGQKRGKTKSGIKTDHPDLEAGKLALKNLKK